MLVSKDLKKREGGGGVESDVGGSWFEETIVNPFENFQSLYMISRLQMFYYF